MNRIEDINKKLEIRKNRLKSLENISAPIPLIQNELNMIDELNKEKKEIKRKERKSKLNKLNELPGPS
jgi:hypothetical protein